jgi:dGTPase
VGGLKRFGIFEVSRVGSALGKELGQRLVAESKLPSEFTPNDLAAVVQAACLAHDLGNPPFGHAGEDAIIHWFAQNREIMPSNWDQKFFHDIESLEGNAQGFRIITQLENHIFKGGLRLTYATLGTFQKYPWTSEQPGKKFGSFLSEEKILDTIFTELRLEKNGGQWSRHPLAFLVEAADDICYGIIDIEDAVELRILPFSKAADLLLRVLPPNEAKNIRESFEMETSHRVNFARMRGKVFDAAIQGAIEAFMQHYDDIMLGGFHKNLFDLLPESDRRRQLITDAKKLGRESIYTDTKKVEIEIGCYATFDPLLREFSKAALNKADILSGNSDDKKLLWKSEHVLRLLGDHAPSKDNAPPDGWSAYQCVRRVIDFVSGMTDNYAIYLARQLQGTGFSGGQRP